MNVKWLFFLFLMPCAALAQGFAGLGSSADDGFLVPQPNPRFEFPKDHGAHDGYRIEWWYITANLKADDGTNYGLQWTLFKSALKPLDKPGWQSPYIWMGHAAVTTPENHYVTERLARGGIGQAGAQAAPFKVWIDDWKIAGTGDLSDLQMTASGNDFAYDMRLNAQGPLVFQGKDGYSVKSAEGQASYYYSQPFFAIEGMLKLPDGDVNVTGEAWLDREWSSQPLGDAQTGWDWFSLSFDDGYKMMGFQLRNRDGSAYTSATWIEPDGTATPFPDGAFTAEPLAESSVAGRTFPTKWRARLPDKNVDVTVNAINPNAWMATSVSYWEGPVLVTGSHTGRGYLEMTGYE